MGLWLRSVKGGPRQPMSLHLLVESQLLEGPHYSALGPARALRGVACACVWALSLSLSLSVCVCVCVCVPRGFHHFYQVSRLSLYGHTGVLGSGRSPL